MAITPANSNYKSFTFNGISARQYGVYVTDVNVFDSAQREVEYITIPGRNGQFALDHGRFENVTVKYSCAMGADSETDFAQAISDFRNALASVKGYKRLEDDMNPDEYRMAVFSAGITAPTLNRKAATFDVEFNCKPQRYLTSGETAVSVASGATVTNPTLFEASPLIKCKGTGTINIDGQEITVSNDPIGKILLANGVKNSGSVWADFSTAMLKSGDRIFTENDCSIRFHAYGIGALNGVVSVSNVTTSGVAKSVATYILHEEAIFDVTVGGLDFVNGTASTKAVSVTFDMTYSSGGTTGTASCSVSYNIVFNGSTQIAFFVNETSSVPSNFGASMEYVTTQAIYGDSTKLPVEDTLYFDTDIGEAYTYMDGEMVSVNNAVDFGTYLPVLKPGDSEITYSSTMTTFQITPRWWVV